tara:strand:- start:537 stop:836 length:300 start_codon:yes stop_codon:yes gene_type:complete
MRSALSCGIVYKTCRASLPENYELGHIYHSLYSEPDPLVQTMEKDIEKFYSGKPMDFMAFGERGAKNAGIHTSITIVHLFFGKFKLTSMLTRTLQAVNS